MHRISMLSFVVALAIAGFCTAAAPEDGTYSSKYDKVDLEGLLNDPTQVEALLQCFLQEGDGDPCSEMGRRVKAVLPEALPQNCAKCTDAQRKGLAKTVKFLAAKMPDKWSQLQAKFDPQGAYAKEHPELFQ